MKVFISLLVAISLLSCKNDDVLNYCPSTKACIIVDDQVQLIEPESPEYITLNTGSCQTGVVRCLAENAISCEGYVPFSSDICDGLDNNCNGIIDDGFDVDSDSFTTCAGDCDDRNDKIYPGAPELCDGLDNDCDGLISLEEQDVDEDGYPICEGDCDDNNPLIRPNAYEICDNIDNDCDGEIDEDIYATICGPETSAGVCDYGRNYCIDGELLCVGASYPQEEVCDGIDNNCNSWVDEGIQSICHTACGQGVQFCHDGDWFGCTAPEPQEEVCDNFDNDCDGDVDEGCPCSIGDTQTCMQAPMYDINTGEELTDPYPCGEGIQFCNELGEYGDCFFFRTLEETCNAWDDDCDGTVDSMHVSCSDVPSLVGTGQCEAGLSYCEMGSYGDCIGQVLPEEEFCDGLDNDCDGLVDEELNPHDKVDIIFIVDISGSMQGYIDSLAQAMSLYAADFADTEHKFGLITTGRYEEFSVTYSLVTGGPGQVLVDVGDFISVLGNLQANGMSLEYTYDISYLACDPDDAIGISWREDAHPYIILMTDEPGQTDLNLQQSEVALRSNNCTVGTCEPGDPYEFFVITKPLFSHMWVPITHYESDKVKNILINDVASYVDMLKDMFTDVCR